MWWSFGIFGWVSIVWSSTTTHKGTKSVVYLCLITGKSQAPTDKVPIRFVDSHTFFQKFLIPACQDFPFHRTCLLASLPHIDSQPTCLPASLIRGFSKSRHQKISCLRAYTTTQPKDKKVWSAALLRNSRRRGSNPRPWGWKYLKEDKSHTLYRLSYPGRSDWSSSRCELAADWWTTKRLVGIWRLHLGFRPRWYWPIGHALKPVGPLITLISRTTHIFVSSKLARNKLPALSNHNIPRNIAAQAWSIGISHRIALLLDAMQELLREDAIESQEPLSNPYTVSSALFSSQRREAVDSWSHVNRKHHYEPFFAITYMLLLLWLPEPARNSPKPTQLHLQLRVDESRFPTLHCYTLNWVSYEK
jgi:hypothetical protein